MAHKLSKRSLERVEALLQAFSQESKEIRDELVSRLPSYNELLGMHALSFEEFALLPIAKKKGLAVDDLLFSYRTVQPPCPKCGCDQGVRRVDENTYVCPKCKFKFAANWQSISSGTKVDSTVWLKLLRCMLDFYSIDRTCESCGISRNTYYQIRSKLFYAMTILLGNIKLYGHIQVDHTFVPANYKGFNLDDPEYPDNSPFEAASFIPRAAKKRGGTTKADSATNQICILAAVDDHSHVITRFVGVGASTSALVQRAFGQDRILLTVPTKDPYSGSLKKKVSPETSPGDQSLLISDGEKSIARFAKLYGISHECHVYRKNGVQRRLPVNAHDIQRVNNLHSRLKEFLQKIHFVSSKYLPGYLVLFEFIENTGATPEALCELFCILARPGLGKPPIFYDELFSMPNYLAQWASEDNPLRHFKYNQLLAFYLYDLRKEALAAGDEFVFSAQEIAERCEMSMSSVRRNYNNLKSAGYSELIKDYFRAQETARPEKAPRCPDRRPTLPITPTLLYMYDEWGKNRCLIRNERLTLIAFVEKMNKKCGTEYTVGQLSNYFKRIPDLGLRPPLPPIPLGETPEGRLPHKLKNIEMHKEYKALVADYRRRGLKVPLRDDLAGELAEKHGLTRDRVISMITHLPAGYTKQQD